MELKISEDIFIKTGVILWLLEWISLSHQPVEVYREVYF